MVMTDLLLDSAPEAREAADEVRNIAFEAAAAGRTASSCAWRGRVGPGCSGLSRKR